MKVIAGYGSSIVCLLLILQSTCVQKKLGEQERFDLYLQTLSGDSTGYRISYALAQRVDTLYGFYPLSMSYVPLKLELDSYDTLAQLYLAKRDSTFNRPYVPSSDKVYSTYINWNRFNDSARLYLRKGGMLRNRIEDEAIAHSKTVKGYVVDFNVSLIKEDDTLLVHKFDIWLNANFPIGDL